MRHLLIQWYLLLLFLCAHVSITAQVDVTDRTIDIRNDLRSLWQKSNIQTAPNIIALPIFAKAQAKPISIPFGQTDESLYESTIIQGDGAETYLVLSNAALNPGERLIISSPQGLWYEDIISSKHNRPSQKLILGPYQGDISLHWSSDRPPVIQLEQVYAHPVNSIAMDLGFDASFGCHVNINCEEGGHFNNEKRSVMRIRMVAEEGIALCTGTLLNNTSEDRTPYVLTAFHCLVPVTGTITPIYDMWLFDFHYEGFSCANPQDEPIPFVVQGAQKLAEWEDTDMMLLKITEAIPNEANVYFAGWNRDVNYVPDTTFMIHHPVGDIKKISIDQDSAKIHERKIGWNNGGNSPEYSHYLNDFDLATYEPGSSGASIFDKTGLVLGQLHGGPLSDESCSLGIGYSGRLSVSWDAGNAAGERLKDWLDPLGQAPMQLAGMNPDINEVVRLSGKVITADGLAIPEVQVTLVGDQVASFFTGTDGIFVFENLDPEGSYQLSIEKNTNVGNGLSATDLVIIRNHIIGRKIIEDHYALLSADVSGDGNISSNDLVQIRNIIIGRQTQFPANPSWDFEPNALQLDGANTPTSSAEIIIIGFKLGDVNYSAKPGN